jgi:cell division protein FtsW
MARTLRSDKFLFWATLLLVGVSAVMVYSASAVQSVDEGNASSYQLVRQLAWVGIGLLVMAAAMRIDYHQYRRQEVIWALVGVAAAGLVAVFFFPAKHDTNRWITIRTFSIQPAEFAKLAAVIFAAALLERRMHRVNDVGYALAPIGLVIGAFAGLMVMQPDFGTAAVVVLVVTTVIFAAGLSYRYLLGTALVLLPTAMALIVTSPYRMRRVQTFLDPWADPLKDGYQVIQSLIAVGSGGVTGKGLMGGVQKLYYIPEAHNDFIFAVIAEEFGLIGTTVILLCFVTIAWRGIRASVLAPDRFGSLLAIGLTMMVVLQALMNLSVVTGLLPNKGIPLPLVSAGGSSLIVSMAAMGILLNISQQSLSTAASAPRVAGEADAVPAAT